MQRSIVAKAWVAVQLGIATLILYPLAKALWESSKLVLPIASIMIATATAFAISAMAFWKQWRGRIWWQLLPWILIASVLLASAISGDVTCPADDGCTTDEPASSPPCQDPSATICGPDT